MAEIDLHQLFDRAAEAAEKAYAPYSQFPVGAAILLPDGKIQTGFNIENRSYGATNCAERTAWFSAMAAGYTTFLAIAIVAPKADYPVPPCGICRQVLSEFAGPDTPVVFGNSWDSKVITDLAGVYPYDSLHELAK